MTLEQLAPRLTEPLVRSLAWLIGSPNLLDEHDPRFAGRLVNDTWCAQALGRSAAWLEALDRDPQPLLDFVAAEPTRRLGRLAESLLAFWLAQEAGVQLLARNLAVRDAKRTLGEFDFIFRTNGQAQATHWEAAVKFYLRRPEIDGLAGYVGPGERDTLAAKSERVFERQLALGETVEGKAALATLGVDALQPRAFIKGFLFYPHGHASIPEKGVSAGHAHGWWLRALPGWEQALDAQCRYKVLPRLHWLAWPALAAQDDLLDRDALAVVVAQGMHADSGAVMVAALAPSGDGSGAWRERERGFVVPAGWGG